MLCFQLVMLPQVAENVLFAYHSWFTIDLIQVSSVAANIIQSTNMNLYFPAGTDLFIQNDQGGFRLLLSNQMLTFGVFEHVNYFGIHIIHLSLSTFISVCTFFLWVEVLMWCFKMKLTSRKKLEVEVRPNSCYSWVTFLALN